MGTPDFGPPSRAIIVGFAAGAISALTFHAFAWWVFYQIGQQALAPWPMRPNGFGVPLMISLAFWAGLWGVVLALVAPRLAGRRPFWQLGLALSVAATLVQLFVVPMLRGAPVAAGWNAMAIIRAFIINGTWGIGVAVLATNFANFARRRSSAA